MAQLTYWWPGGMAAQLLLIQNFLAKIAGYQATLGLTIPQVAAITAVCEAFIGAFNATQQSKQTMKAMSQWRRTVFYGEPVGDEAPQAPVFPTVGVVTYTRGVIAEFKDFRDMIVALPNYTEQIGEDLGIVGTEINPIGPTEAQPVFKSVTANGYTVNLVGSMQGFDGMRVEYRRKGGDWENAAFLTNTPAGFQVTPAVPGGAEAGHVRAVFIKKNEDYGLWSPDYPVTVS